MILSIEAKLEISGQYTVTLEKHDDYPGCYKVRYGLEVTPCPSYEKAVAEFKHCARHAQECAGWFADE